jgi:hypothetical protein
LADRIGFDFQAASKYLGGQNEDLKGTEVETKAGIPQYTILTKSTPFS